MDSENAVVRINVSELIGLLRIKITITMKRLLNHYVLKEVILILLLLITSVMLKEHAIKVYAQEVKDDPLINEK